MAIKSIIEINGIPQSVTVVDVDITGSSIYLTYISDLTQEVFVIQETKDRPYNIPTKIGDFISLAGSDGLADEKGQPDGIATLDGDGKVPASQLPPLAITDVFVVNSEAEMLALVAERGDVAIRTDLSGTAFILASEPASTLANWVELSSAATVSAISNVGTGEGVFKGMNGAVAELKSLLEGSNKLTIVANADDLTFDIVEANLTLNNIGGTLGPTKGGTGLSTYTTGDLLYASAANVLSKLAAGTDGYVLTMAAGIPSWAAPAATGITGSGSAGTFPIFTGSTAVGDSSLSVAGTVLTNTYTDNKFTGELAVGDNVSPVTKLNVFGNTHQFGTVQIGTDIVANPTSLYDQVFLGLGRNNYGNGTKFLIGFGYNVGGSNKYPGMIGFEMTDSASSTIGDLVFATRPTTTDAAPTERIRITSDGNILIATTTNDGVNKLQVAGMVKFTASTGTATFGSVGLLDRLVVLSGGAANHSSIRIGRTTEDAWVGVSGSSDQFSTIDVAGDLSVTNNTLNLILCAHNATGHIKFATGTISTEKMRITNSGRVLIGTTTDDGSTTLQILGNVAIGATGSNKLNVFGTHDANGLLIIRSTSALNDYSKVYLGFGGGEWSLNSKFLLGFGYRNSPTDVYPVALGFNMDDTGFGTKGSIVFATRDSTGSTVVPTERMRVSAAGNLLIGTTSDNGINKLQVNGSISATDLLVFSDSNPTIRTNSVDGADGNTLHLTGGGAVSSGRGSLISLCGNEVVGGIGGTLNLNAGNVSTGDVILRTAGSAQLTVKNSGNVLIGTTTDDTLNKLQVTGSLYVSGNINTNGDIVMRQQFSILKTNTLDGADDKSMFLCGGGDTSVSRGAYIQLYGNEFGSGLSGEAILLAGGSGNIRFSAGGERMRLLNNGRLLLGTSTDAGSFLLQVEGNGRFVSGLTVNTNNDVSTVGNVPTWIEYTVTHTMLQLAALNNDIELFSLPAGYVIHAVKIKHSVAFAGTGITGYTLSLGIVGNLTKYTSAFDVFQVVGGTIQQLSDTVQTENNDVGTSIRLAATSVDANLDQSTTGTVKIKVLVSNAQV